MTSSTIYEQHQAVLTEYTTLKRQLPSLVEQARLSNKLDDLKQTQRRLGHLKNAEAILRKQLTLHKQATKQEERRRQYRREEIFIDLARKHLGEQTYHEIWKEVDRLEEAQWRAVWSSR